MLHYSPDSVAITRGKLLSVRNSDRLGIRISICCAEAEPVEMRTGCAHHSAVLLAVVPVAIAALPR